MRSTPAMPGVCGKRRIASRSANSALAGCGQEHPHTGCDKTVLGPLVGLTAGRAPGALTKPPTRTSSAALRAAHESPSVGGAGGGPRRDDPRPRREPARGRGRQGSVHGQRPRLHAGGHVGPARTLAAGAIGPPSRACHEARVPRGHRVAEAGASPPHRDSRGPLRGGRHPSPTPTISMRLACR